MTGYDGLFYPEAARDFLRMMDEDGADFDLPDEFFTHSMTDEQLGKSSLVSALYSLYW